MSLSKTRYGQVVEFNKQILGIKPRLLGLQSPDEAGLSATQMAEEVQEYKAAWVDNDYIGCIDAIIDELYFCYGILYKLGLDEDLVNEMFDIVHTANMLKAKGKKAGRDGFDAADATKPDDWVDPRKAMTDLITKGRAHEANNS